MKHELPKTDSIQELAHFWDEHDLTDFEEQLEEVQEPVFEGAMIIPLNLAPEEASAVRSLAKSQGVAEGELVRSWVLEKIRAS